MIEILQIAFFTLMVALGSGLAIFLAVLFYFLMAKLLDAFSRTRIGSWLMHP